MKNLSILCALIAVIVLFSCKDKPANTNQSQTSENPFVESLVKKQMLTGIYSVEYDYTVSLPPDFKIDEYGGEDFVVYYFAPADTTVLSYFVGGIYFGNHPNPFKYCENDSSAVKTVQSELLGKNEDWKIHNCDNKYLTQTLAKSGSNEHWCEYIHLFGNATSELELEKLFEIFKTISKKKKLEGKEIE